MSGRAEFGPSTSWSTLCLLHVPAPLSKPLGSRRRRSCRQQCPSRRRVTTPRVDDGHVLYDRFAPNATHGSSGSTIMTPPPRPAAFFSSRGDFSGAGAQRDRPDLPFERGEPRMHVRLVAPLCQQGATVVCAASLSDSARKTVWWRSITASCLTRRSVFRAAVRARWPLPKPPRRAACSGLPAGAVLGSPASGSKLRGVQIERAADRGVRKGE